MRTKLKQPKVWILFLLISFFVIAGFQMLEHYSSNQSSELLHDKKNSETNGTFLAEYETTYWIGIESEPNISSEVLRSELKAISEISIEITRADKAIEVIYLEQMMFSRSYVALAKFSAEKGVSYDYSVSFSARNPEKFEQNNFKLFIRPNIEFQTAGVITSCLSFLIAILLTLTLTHFVFLKKLRKLTV